MKPGYEQFMAAIEVAKDAQAGMVRNIAKMMRAGEPAELIYARLAQTVHSDMAKAATAAMVALYRLAELEVKRDEDGIRRYAADGCIEYQGYRVHRLATAGTCALGCPEPAVTPDEAKADSRGCTRHSCYRCEMEDL